METKYIGMLGAFAAVSLVFFAMGATASTMLIAEPMKTQSTAGWISGHVTTTVFDEYGNIKHYAQSDNAVMNNGEDCAMQMLFDLDGSGVDFCTNAVSDFSHIGIGTSNAPVAVTQSILTAEVAASRTQDTACAFTAANGATTAGTCLLSAQFTGFTAVVEESGVFDAIQATGGNMFARQLTGTISLVPADTLQVDWTFTIDGTTNP